MVTIGDGKLALFWHSSWVHGTTPKNIAPSMFKKAKRGNLTVQKALQDNRWISHIIPLNTAEEIREYVELWEAIGKRSLTRTGKIVFGDDGRQTANTQPRVRTTINSKELSAN